MSRLEHINLSVHSLQPTQEFLLCAFPEWRVRGTGCNQWGEVKRQWMHLGDDDYYITLNDGAQGDIRDLASVTPGLAHAGFVVDDVDKLIARMSDQGFSVSIFGQPHPFRKTVYYTDPAGFQFEFIEYFSEQPDQKNLYGHETGPLIFNHQPQGIKMINTQQYCKSLYQIVDNEDVSSLAELLAENVEFRIANMPSIVGKKEVLAGNKQFFQSIHKMTHKLDGIYDQAGDIFCHGSVDYVRLDGSSHQAFFSTVLKFEQSKIVKYYVFADLSKL
jgi:ketosteroid isomerase-like protein